MRSVICDTYVHIIIMSLCTGHVSIVISLSMVVLNSRDWPENGVWNFDVSKIHLRVGFLRKSRLKCIGTSIITLYLC